jgi:hypothetical protein
MLCFYEMANEWSRAQGVDPVPGTFELVVVDDVITEIVHEADESWGAVFSDWFEWLIDNHEDEIRTLFRFDDEDRFTGGPATDPDAIALYQQRVPEYVAFRTGS